MNSELSELEKNVIKAILKSNDKNDMREKLFCQYKGLCVKKRTFTNVGFFTEFYDCDDIFLCEGIESLRLGGIHAEVSNLKYGAGFVLYIKNGRIVLLEGYCYDEKWPNDADIIELFKVQENGSLLKI